MRGSFDVACRTPEVGAGARIPLLSLALGLLACLPMLLPPAVQELLYFDRSLLARGNPAGLVAGHWLHAGLEHLAWNVAALVILAALLERHSRRLLVVTVCVGMLAVDALLVSPLCDLQRYCGLSGLLNTLLGVALYLQWRESRSPLVVLIAAACLAKIALEVYSGQSLFTDIDWPPFAAAHLAGITGAALVVVCLRAARSAAVPGATE